MAEIKVMRDLVGGTLSGRYRMVSRIAGGGMGEVYRAHDLLLDRPVAIKVLHPSLASDPELVDRFRLEARAAARLTHPSVVSVHDWGEDDDGIPYMVMEYVAGTDLRDVLVARGALDPAQAVEVVAEVCDALAAAHGAGLVHRDVKPENVLLSCAGRVKVADFGIAIFGDAERSQPGGDVPGTLRYLAPEQARGLDATLSSDIWAAGALLFECLTGRPPSMGAGDLLKRRAEEHPRPPSELEPAVPPEVDDVVLRACALDPGARYPGAGDMADDLRKVAVHALPPAKPLRTLLEDVTTDIRLPEMEPTVAGSKRAPRRRRARGPRHRRAEGALGRPLVPILVALLVLVAGGVGATAALLGPKEVDVPALEGLPEPEAVRVAREVGLQAEVTDRIRHREVARGDVVSQDPDGGTLVEGGTVRLVVSKGPPLTPVPPVAGKDLDRAVAALEGARLVVGWTREEWSVQYPAGVVIGTSATKQRVPEGTIVNLVVSRGPRTLEVPEVAGMKAARAAEEIERAGFVAVPVEAYSDDVEPGRIISSEPAAGASADEGSEITLYVSIGPEFEELSMPDVRGMHVDDAKRRLLDLGLRVRVVVSCEGGSTVVETDPRARARVRENDRVALFVC